MSQFSKQADLYAKYRPDYPEEAYDFIFKHLVAREKAWDCATGSGQVAKYLAPRFKEVHATDISLEQLSHAPTLENVTYHQSSAEVSGLPADYFDLITVGQAIHWFNFDGFYKEVRRVAKNKALLAVMGYGMIRINATLNPIIDELYEEVFGTYYNENRLYLDQQYRTIPFPFGEITAPPFKQRYRWSLEQLKGYFNSWSAIQRMKSDQGRNPAEKAMQRISEIRDATNDQLDVHFPVFLRLGKIE